MRWGNAFLSQKKENKQKQKQFIHQKPCHRNTSFLKDFICCDLIFICRRTMMLFRCLSCFSLARFLKLFFATLCMHSSLPPILLLFSLFVRNVPVSHPLTFTPARRYLFLTLLSFYHILHLTKCVQFLVVHHTFLVFRLCFLCIIYCFSRSVFTW